MQLVEALKRFNRKERYWLIRNALGPHSARLGGDFRHRLGAVVGAHISKSAWWAMDYHLDWLAGAFALLGSPDANKLQLDIPQPDSKFGLVLGKPTDIDLLIAFDNTLILVEAKGATSWNNEQLQKKVQRITHLLNASDMRAIQSHELAIHMVLTSPKNSVGLEPENSSSGWPLWLQDCEGKPNWLHLHMAEANETPDYLTVTRCHKDGTVSASGSTWKIIAGSPSVNKPTKAN